MAYLLIIALAAAWWLMASAIAATEKKVQFLMLCAFASLEYPSGDPERDMDQLTDKIIAALGD